MDKVFIVSLDSGEEIYEDTGRASGMVLDGIGEDGDKASEG